MKHRILFVSFIVLIVTSLVVMPAFAITFGEPDGERHPNVGALFIPFPNPDSPPIQMCSGTLIAPTVFLTAAHCFAWMPDYGIPLDMVFLTFDSVYDSEGSTFYHGTPILNPNFGHDMGDRNDVAVFILDVPITDIQPAQLPTAGLLDELQAAGALKDQSFVTVGYGSIRDDKTGGPKMLYSENMRRFTTGTYNALTQSWLKISMNPSTGDGGTCYGDSGGPHFLGESDLVVSVTVTGDRYCRATDVTYRLDTESARTFLTQYVGLP
jgi:hypothetical protein